MLSTLLSCNFKRKPHDSPSHVALPCHTNSYATKAEILPHFMDLHLSTGKYVDKTLRLIAQHGAMMRTVQLDSDSDPRCAAAEPRR
eukprot:4633362-Amphidinium_carterae.1